MAYWFRRTPRPITTISPRITSRLKGTNQRFAAPLVPEVSVTGAVDVGVAGKTVAEGVCVGVAVGVAVIVFVALGATVGVALGSGIGVEDGTGLGVAVG